jgi:alkyl hydroperoxide reductase subunit D
MSIFQNETIASFFNELGIPATHTSFQLEKLVAADSRFLRDLKLNVANVLGSNHFTKKEAFLLALAVANNQKNEVLQTVFEALARKEEANDAEIAETIACTAVMNINNVFYRFRHYLVGNEYYEKTPAGLRMNVMMNPVLGKEFFELMSMAVSALNGCERCVSSHENSVKQQGASEARIYDAVRLVAVIKSLCIVC